MLSTLEAKPEQPYEQRLANYVVAQHLARHSYRMAAVTLAEEAGPTEWSTVGLSMEQPPALTSILRYFFAVGPNKEKFDLDVRPLSIG